MFIEEFEIKNENDVNMFVMFVDEYKIKNLNELKMKANITKHVEYNFIYFEFSNNFKADDISDDVVITLLDNIENRL